MPAAAPIVPVIAGVGGLIGAISQQQQASAAQAMSREALEIQKKLIDEYANEIRATRPYREALRELTANRMTWAPTGWSRWTSDPWRLTPSLPAIAKMLNPPSVGTQPSNGTQNPPSTGPTTPPYGQPWDYIERGPYERGGPEW